MQTPLIAYNRAIMMRTCINLINLCWNGRKDYKNREFNENNAHILGLKTKERRCIEQTNDYRTNAKKAKNEGKPEVAKNYLKSAIMSQNNAKKYRDAWEKLEESANLLDDAVLQRHSMLILKENNKLIAEEKKRLYVDLSFFYYLLCL